MSNLIYLVQWQGKNCLCVCHNDHQLFGIGYHFKIFRSQVASGKKVNFTPWIDRNKNKRGKLSITLSTCHATVHQHLMKTMGGFHYAKDFWNFSQKSNGKIHFGFFRLEYLGSPLEVVHLFRSNWSDWNLLFHFWKTGSLPYLANHLLREFGTGIKKCWVGFLLVGLVWLEIAAPFSGIFSSGISIMEAPFMHVRVLPVRLFLDLIYGKELSLVAKIHVDSWLEIWAHSFPPFEPAPNLAKLIWVYNQLSPCGHPAERSFFGH